MYTSHNTPVHTQTCTGGMYQRVGRGWGVAMRGAKGRRQKLKSPVVVLVVLWRWVSNAVLKAWEDWMWRMSEGREFHCFGAQQKKEHEQLAMHSAQRRPVNLHSRQHELNLPTPECLKGKGVQKLTPPLQLSLKLLSPPSGQGWQLTPPSALPRTLFSQLEATFGVQCFCCSYHLITCSLSLCLSVSLCEGFSSK